MFNKKSKISSFADRGKFFSIFIFLVLCSFNCYSESQSGSVQPQKPFSFKPECAPTCDKISTIAFYFVDKNNIFTKDQKELMLNEIKESVVTGRPDIKFVPVHLDYAFRSNQLLSTSIQTELFFKKNDCDESSIKVGVKLIFRNRFYVDEFFCSSKEKFSCVNDYIRKEIKTKIDDYLFKPTNSAIQ